MRTVVFVFDYVMHYHREMLRAVEAHLNQRGIRFVLLTARHRELGAGRTPLRDNVVAEQGQYSLVEKRLGGFTLRHQSGVVSEIKRLSPSVVVTMCHSGTLSEWLIARLKRRLGFRLVAWQCGYEYNPGRLKDTILSAFVPNFDHHLAYHSNARDYAIKYGATPEQITVMHNTINEQLIQCSPKNEARERIAQKHPSLQGRHIVLYVGAVLEEKRLELAVDALDLLTNLDVSLVVVGDGPHLAHLQAITAHRTDVVFAGRVVDGVGLYFDAADVFLLPGTGGLALNEAMAHSLPLISGYADGSADDLVVDGVNGFRLHDVTPRGIAEKVSALVTDRELNAKMGQASHELITSKYSFERFIQRVVTVLEAA